jgi:hypothetical protein
VSADEQDKEWAALYVTLRKSLASLGTENAFGEGDYWIVDDNYGDKAHKLCIHKLSFLRPPALASMQTALQRFPGWRIVVQMEAEVNGVPLPPEGLVIYADGVEQHWDRSRFAALAKSLHLED